MRDRTRVEYDPKRRSHRKRTVTPRSLEPLLMRVHRHKMSWDRHVPVHDESCKCDSFQYGDRRCGAHFRRHLPFARLPSLDFIYREMDDRACVYDAPYTREDWRYQDDDRRLSTMHMHRLHSLQVMAEVQRKAAQLIQEVFRVYRKRRRDAEHQQQVLCSRALVVFNEMLLHSILPFVASEAIIDVLRDELSQATARRYGKAEELKLIIENVYDKRLGEIVVELFHMMVDAMVREYMLSQLDTTRVSVSQDLVIAQEVLDLFVTDFVRVLVNEALQELVESYFTWRRCDDMWECFVREQLRDAALEVLGYDCVLT